MIGSGVVRSDARVRMGTILIGMSTLVLAGTPAAAQVTFVKDRLSASARTPPKPPNGPDSSSATTIGTADLSASQFASSNSNTAQATGSVAFTSPLSGRLTIADIEGTAGPAMFPFAYDASASLSFGYTFSVSTTFAVFLGANITATPAAGAGYSLLRGNAIVAGSDFAEGQSFFLSDYYAPGDYTLFLNAAVQARAATTGDTFRKVSGSADFQIIPNGRMVPPAVPEPTAWALMIVGFGAVGAGLRRRRSGRVTAEVASA